MKNEKWLYTVILIICAILGIGISIWTTGVQAEFLAEMGVSRWGAMTIEPLLIIVSFLLGIKITKTHKVISMSFLVILFGISLITMVSMYTKRSFVTLETQKEKTLLGSKSTQSEEAIRNALSGLSERGTTSSKNIVKVIDQLQKQNDKTEKSVKSETLELQAIIETVSKLTGLKERDAVLFFAFFVSLAAVFSPSFLFFTAGMMLKSTGIFDGIVTENPVDRMKELSLKQKIVLLTKENVTKDVTEMAKFLETSEAVIQAQLTRIDKKMGDDTINLEDEGIKI